MQYDICYFSGFGSTVKDFELKYSIRSIYHNFREAGDLYLLGSCPDFINKSKVNHIYFDDEPTRNKDRNLINKIAYLGGEIGLSADFIMNSDDHFVMKPVGVDDFGPFFSKSKMNDRNKLWQRRLMRTFGVLLANGFSANNFDSHTPQLLKRELCREVLRFNFDGTGLCVFTLYHNLSKTPGSCQLTESVLHDARASFDQNNDSRFIISNKNTVKRRQFLEYISEKFPNKSQFEL